MWHIKYKALVEPDKTANTSNATASPMYASKDFVYGVVGPSVTVNFTHAAQLYTVRVSGLAKSGNDKGVVKQWYEAPVMCKYVRREMRKLTEEDRNKFLSALEITHRLNYTEGKGQFGDKFVDARSLTSKHLAKVRGRRRQRARMEREGLWYREGRKERERETASPARARARSTRAARGYAPRPARRCRSTTARRTTTATSSSPRTRPSRSSSSRACSRSTRASRCCTGTTRSTTVARHALDA